MTTPKIRRPLSRDRIDSTFAGLEELSAWERETVAAIHAIVRVHVERLTHDAQAAPNLMFSDALAWSFAETLAGALTPGNVIILEFSEQGREDATDQILRGLAGNKYAQAIVLTKPMGAAVADLLNSYVIEAAEFPCSLEPEGLEVNISHVSWFAMLDVKPEYVPRSLHD